MSSTRILLLMILTGGSVWLWTSGEWRGLADRGRGLAAGLPMVGTALAAGPAAEAAPLPSTDQPPVIQVPDNVMTWRDADGTVHYARQGEAPADADPHRFGKPATMADYEASLEDETGITMEHIYKAQQARLREDAAQAAPEPAPGTIAPEATQQARELLHNQQQTLEQIRRENAK